MLFFNKFLPLFFLPIGLAAILLIFGLVIKKRWPVAVALLILYFSSIPFVGDRLIGWIESRYPAVPPLQVESADAVVVLGGIFGPQVEEGQIVNMADTVERLDAGIVLLQSAKARWLVFTGGRIPWEGRIKSEGDDAKVIAISRGVPAEKILITTEVQNTMDEARAVAALARERGWSSVILVTTGWHMPRAAYLFRKTGIQFTPFPVDFRRDRRKKLTVLDFVPKAEALANTETALRETYGYWFYRLLR